MVMNMFGKIVLAAAAVSSAMVASAFAAGKVACVGNSITYGYGIESGPIRRVIRIICRECCAAMRRAIRSKILV